MGSIRMQPIPEQEEIATKILCCYLICSLSISVLKSVLCGRLCVCIIVCGFDMHVKLRNRHIPVDKAINRSEYGLCGLCACITRIIRMRIYFVYGSKSERKVDLLF